MGKCYQTMALGVLVMISLGLIWSIRDTKVQADHTDMRRRLPANIPNPPPVNRHDDQVLDINYEELSDVSVSDEDDNEETAVPNVSSAPDDESCCSYFCKKCGAVIILVVVVALCSIMK